MKDLKKDFGKGLRKGLGKDLEENNEIVKVNIFHNPFVKIIVVVLFIVSSIMTVFNFCNFYVASDTRAYSYIENDNEYVDTLIYNNLRRNSNIEYIFLQALESDLENSAKGLSENLVEVHDVMFQNSNLTYTIYNQQGEIIANTHQGKMTPHKYGITMNYYPLGKVYHPTWDRMIFAINDGAGYSNYYNYTAPEATVTQISAGNYTENEEIFQGSMMIYIDNEFKEQDIFYHINQNATYILENKNNFISNSIGLFFVSLSLLVPLTIGVGRNSKREDNKVKNNFLCTIPFDVFTFIFVPIGTLVLLYLLSSSSDDIIYMTTTDYLHNFLVYYVYQIILVFVCLIYYVVFVAHIKNKTLISSSIIGISIKKFFGFFSIKEFIKNGIKEIFSNMGVYIKTIIGLIIYSIYSLFSDILGDADSEILFFLIPQIILTWAFCLYIAYMIKELEKASNQMSTGNIDININTKKFKFGFKSFGDNLNKIAEGVGIAVDERMKSERMKTELITNVSHDIKTPLTSIINYADLIGKEKTDNEKINEYTEVILRQSHKLRRLTDDLVEASKASTGNLDVELEPFEVNVLFSQIVGEYAEKLNNKKLDLIISQLEKEINILGDGRRMWRVFDNLMNNISNYAQENTRIYLNVEEVENEVVISFKNVSKYPLNITADELMERFVRGDSSRNTEGNGLGLSIAKSLTELQNGKFEIIIDGDLFKVMLKFPKL